MLIELDDGNMVLEKEDNYLFIKVDKDELYIDIKDMPKDVAGSYMEELQQAEKSQRQRIKRYLSFYWPIYEALRALYYGPANEKAIYKSGTKGSV